MEPITKRFYLAGAPCRLSVSLNRSTFDRVMATSTYQGRSASNLCAFLIERGLEALQRSTANLS